MLDVDVLFVRENSAGVYQGKSSARREHGRIRAARLLVEYDERHVERIRQERREYLAGFPGLAEAILPGVSA